MEQQRLNFPPRKFRLSIREGREYIWDSLRGCWLRCTPEEWVRQHVIPWLEEDVKADRQFISQEHPVCLEGMMQRADIVVFDKNTRPIMLVECKAPDVAIDNVVLAQAVRYNSVVGARYIMLTNGLLHYFYEMAASGDYSPLACAPVLG